jgi:hypothetical protein
LPEGTVEKIVNPPEKFLFLCPKSKRRRVVVIKFNSAGGRNRQGRTIQAQKIGNYQILGGANVLLSM